MKRDSKAEFQIKKLEELVRKRKISRLQCTFFCFFVGLLFMIMGSLQLLDPQAFVYSGISSPYSNSSARLLSASDTNILGYGGLAFGFFIFLLGVYLNRIIKKEIDCLIAEMRAFSGN